MAGPGYAVIDVETTGFVAERHDRIVEIAVVHVDAGGAVTGSWETLLNPHRDLGAQHIHGIRARDVLDAPDFSDIASDLIDLLSGRVLVAHNAAFDSRFLYAEFSRAGFDVEEELPCLCTMRLAADIIPGSGRSLADCCAAFDIELDGAHRALVDAQATARLLGEYIAATDAGFWHPYLDRAASGRWLSATSSPDVGTRWRARGSDATAPEGFLTRIVERMPDLSGPAEHREYLALLDQCLLDRHLSVHESNELVRRADVLGVSRSTCQRLHREYFDLLVSVAWSDGVLDTNEIADLASVAQLLSLPAEVVTTALVSRPSVTVTDSAPSAFALTPGDVVVITGELSRPRDDWHAELVLRGFVPRPAITKAVTLVVAADPDSLSGKARKARDYGIPIVDEAGLVRLLS
ncbi:DNA polymerase III subunit epsilon [Agromyces atrinae]|uniref:exonuclease domain-containing protein n=1 Tax=Agromyces atrinae TaxID=592376 RepID=UPI001F5904CB|nr:exonuclease domain-containing protein [Agromyces atrinae]MCI2959223.1 DNA polymerase III subunit epsilon [Agromyces atrinae]